MPILTKLASEIFRRYLVDGVVGSGLRKPSLDEIRQWGTEVERSSFAFFGMQRAMAFSANTTYFLGPGGASTAEPEVWAALPYSTGRAKNLILWVGGDPTPGSITATFRRTLADTALTCTVVGGGGVNFATDLTHVVELSAFERSSFKLTSTVGATALQSIAIGCEIEVP